MHLHFDNPPLPEGRRFLPDSESPSVGSRCWPHSSRAHLTGDPGLAGPCVLHKLGVPMQELGHRSYKDRIAQCIRSLHPRPEGQGFPGITGKCCAADHPVWRGLGINTFRGRRTHRKASAAPGLPEPDDRWRRAPAVPVRSSKDSLTRAGRRRAD